MLWGVKDIAEKIIEKKPDYILVVKGNQGTLLEQIEDSFKFLPPCEISIDKDVDHARVEIRKCSVITYLDNFLSEQKEQWANIKSIIKIER